MTDAERAELKRLAEKATRRDWHVESDGGMNPSMSYRIATPRGRDIRTTARNPYHALVSTREDAAFIAAANPAAVLDLLADLALEQRMHKAALDENEQVHAERDALKAEAGALKATVRDLAADAQRHVSACDWVGTVVGLCSRNPNMKPCDYCAEYARLEALKGDA